MITIAAEPKRNIDYISFSVTRNNTELGQIVCRREIAPYFISNGVFLFEADELMAMHKEIKKLDAIRLRKARERAARQNLRG